jgi:hypothetical protein
VLQALSQPRFGAFAARKQSRQLSAHLLRVLHWRKKQSPEDCLSLACYNACMDENAILRELPCLECQEFRAMRARARLGAVVLAVQRGETLPVLPARDLLRGCRKRADEATSSITFLKAGIINW